MFNIINCNTSLKRANSWIFILKFIFRLLLLHAIAVYVHEVLFNKKLCFMYRGEQLEEQPLYTF